MRALLPAVLLFASACPTSRPAPPIEPLPLPPRASLRVEAPPAVALGRRLPLTLRVEGDGAEQRLAVLVKRPGALERSAATRWLDPGVPPPTGAVSYLQPDGTLGDAVATRPLPADGAVIDVPLDAEGRWLVLAQLLRDGQVVQVVSLSAVATSKPALSLAVNRTVANSDDPVRATVTLSAAGASTPVTMYAWIDRPDGTTLVLPNLDPLPRVAWRGPASDVTLPLLGAPLGREGAYELHALLFDDQQALLGLASAGIEVCDAPRTVTGRVVENGALVAERGVVELVDLDDAHVTYEAELGAGRFSTTVPAGRYTVTARPEGRAQGSPVDLVVGCTGDATVELPAGAVLPKKQALTSGVTRQAEVVYASRTRVSIYASSANRSTKVSAAAAELLLVSLATGVYSPTREVMTTTELQGLLGNIAFQQSLGSDSFATLEAVTQKHFDFQLLLQLDDTAGNTVTVSAHLLDPANAQSVWAEARRVPAGDENALNDAVTQLASALVNVPGLAAELYRRQDWPINPVLRMGVTPDKPEIGSTVHATVLLTEKTDGRPEPGKKVFLFYGALFAPPTQLDLVTDDNGVASADIPALSAPGTMEVRAWYVRKNQDVKELRLVDVIRKPTVSAAFEQALMAIEDSIRVDVMIADDARKAGQAVQLTASGGTLDTDTVVTDSKGRATARFTPDGSDATPSVTATALGMTSTAEGLLRPACNERGCAIANDPSSPTHLLLRAEPTDSVSTGGVLRIVADLRVSSGTFANQVIDFSVVGQGRIETSAMTDAAGLARVTYTAPTSGTGTDTIKARVRIAGALIEQSLDIAFAPPCGTCAVAITGPDFVAKNGTATYRANMPVTWEVSAGLGTITNGVLAASAQPGKHRLTARSVDAPPRSASIDVWVSCTRDDLVGTYAATIAYTQNIPAYNPGCPRATSGTLRLAAWPGSPATRFELDLSWPIQPGMPATCGYNPSQPLFATLGDRCDVNYLTDANASSNFCHEVHHFLQLDGALGRLSGNFEVNDVINACAPVLAATVTAVRQ